MEKLSDYLIREDRSGQYTLTKWAGGTKPAAEYHINLNRMESCDCPAGNRNLACKHIGIVKKWIQMGKPEGKVIEASLGFSEEQLAQHRALWAIYKENTKKHLPGTPEYNFERNGDLLHEVYFEALGGHGTEKNSLYERFMRLGMTRGIGWVSMEYNQQNQIIIRWINLHDEVPEKPILLLDCWEHAYMVDFKATERAEYIERWWSCINWQVVKSRLVHSSLAGAQGDSMN